jgi:hypothetical protein
MLVAGVAVHADQLRRASTPSTSTIETSRAARPSTYSTRPVGRRRSVRSAARTTIGAGTSPRKNQAIGTSSASPIAARQASDGEALSFSICER